MKVDFTNEEMEYLNELFDRIIARSKRMEIETPMADKIVVKLKQAQNDSKYPPFVPMKYIRQD